MCTVAPAPLSRVEPVVDVLHGVPIVDPYRWLEDPVSPRTHAWLEAQTSFARTYLDSLPGRQPIRDRVKQLLDVEDYDSFLKSRDRIFFRKRLPGQEQFCIYTRASREVDAEGQDELLIDPAVRGTGSHTAVRPLRVSKDGSLLLYEVKQGGERTGVFEILDVPNRKRLPDFLPHGYVRGFAFAPDSKSFFYAHETTAAARPFYRAAYHHVLGTPCERDREIFSAGENDKLCLMIVSGPRQLGIVVYRFLDRTFTSFYLSSMFANAKPVCVLSDADFVFVPRFLGQRILALTDFHAPNKRIVEVQPRNNCQPLFFDIVPEDETAISDWHITAQHVAVSYTRGQTNEIRVFDSFGKLRPVIPVGSAETVRIVAAGLDDDKVLLRRESFTDPPRLELYAIPEKRTLAWTRPPVRFEQSHYTHCELSFPAKDGTAIPLFLVGRKDLLNSGPRPIVMTSYGGFGVSMTPRFSVLVSFLLERGCLFALPSIRGGSELGAKWHEAAKRRHRQTAFDDFLSAAEWLIETGRTRSERLAIFGGSNSGLLVAAAMTQRPDLFRAVLCLVPLTDMLRYHLFDSAHIWKDEFGTVEDAEDFRALLAYSPYHRVRDNTDYPATMLVSGSVDQNCNPLHARKLAARLQAANSSHHPIVLDYDPFRGHSPVLPLGARIRALTDRLAFLCDQLGLSNQGTP